MVKDFEFGSKIQSLSSLTDIESNSLVFLFQNNNILAINNDLDNKIPTFFFETNSSSWKFEIFPFLKNLLERNWKCIKFGKYFSKSTYLIYLNKNSFHSLHNDQTPQDQSFTLQQYSIWHFVPLEPGINLLIAGIAFHLYTWLFTHQFCGKCGNETSYAQTEFALKCLACSHTEYPQIAPAVIIAITKDDKILLANEKQSPADFYGLIAGFVEPGENLEEAISREVKEEVGIAISNITYFASQPWPFPNSLMLAFTADWLEGEIMVDNKEIMDAQWFSVENFPKIPSSLSMARELIDHFVHKIKSSSRNRSFRI